MRKLPILIVLLPALTAIAQQPSSAGSNWQRVQILPVGTNINVKARDRHAVCQLISVDADTLVCDQGKNHTREISFQRVEILSIKVSHHVRSTLIGLGIGGGTGAVIGFAAGTSRGNKFFGSNFMRGAVTAVFGVAGGVIGAPVGYFTDLSRSTVYTAP